MRAKRPSWKEARRRSIDKGGIFVTYNEAKTEGKEFLKAAGIADYEIDAQYLLEEISGHDRLWFLMNGNEEMSDDEQACYRGLIKTRAEHIPLQHITGRQEFMGLVFKVTKDVLIPRQDTEILTELAGGYSAGKDVLDMCTGSGCIAISIKKLYGAENIVAADISEPALDVAKENAKENGADIEFVQSNLFENITGIYDIIVSNPPYIPTKVIEGLSEEVKVHDPFIALDGMEDGLHFYREIAEKAPQYLKSGGRLMFEIGHDQAKAVSGILAGNGFCNIRVVKDYAGLDRVVHGVKCE